MLDRIEGRLAFLKAEDADEMVIPMAGMGHWG
jgi:hypothetical protein